MRNLTLCSARKENLQSSYFALSSIIIPAVTRIARRWNQTGQKYAGEPDIARTFFFEHRLVLWSLVGATYLWNLQSLASKAFPKISQLARGAAATALATVALTFKLAFTNEDSPELMAGLAKSIVDNDVGFSLVTRARVVFITLGISLIYTLFSGLGRRRPNGSFS
jgi:ethanolaminephosphotransferase